MNKLEKAAIEARHKFEKEQAEEEKAQRLEKIRKMSIAISGFNSPQFQDPLYSEHTLNEISEIIVKERRNAMIDDLWLNPKVHEEMKEFDFEAYQSFLEFQKIVEGITPAKKKLKIRDKGMYLGVSISSSIVGVSVFSIMQTALGLGVSIPGLFIVAIIPFLFSLFIFRKVTVPYDVTEKVAEIAQRFFSKEVASQLAKETDIIFAATNTDLGKVNFQSFYNSEPNEVTSQADKDFYNVFAKHKKTKRNKA